ncbi:MAG: efflux RND transporter periplasmic adaptor subunit [Limnohabitans sp.]
MKSKVSIPLTLTVALATLSACSRQEAPSEPVRAVKVITAGTQDLHNDSVYAGEVRARVESRLGFRVGGKLMRRAVDAGQRVTVGQLLAALDPQDYQLSAQAAQAQLVAAQTQRDVALADFRRYESLKAQGFISGAELERREASLKAAEAALVQARSQSQAQANQVGYAHLQATAAGVVTALEVEVGQVLAAGQPVVRLAHDGPRDAVFSVPEQAVSLIKVGMPMQARIAGGAQSLQGRVREVGASADPVTRTFTVKLALEASERLPLGATVNVLAPAQPHATGMQVIQLPTTALRQQGEGTAVWVLDEASMSVQSQSVTLGPVQARQVAIASGLQPGQKVVVAGVHVLSPGQKVTLYKPATEAK